MDPELDDHLGQMISRLDVLKEENHLAMSRYQSHPDFHKQLIHILYCNEDIDNLIEKLRSIRERI